MKARVFTAQQMYAAQKVAKEILDEQLDDVSIRIMLLWCKAMKDSGYKASSINNVISHFPDVQQMYAHYRSYYDSAPKGMRSDDDKIADYRFYSELRDYGVNVRMTKEEM